MAETGRGLLALILFGLGTAVGAVSTFVPLFPRIAQFRRKLEKAQPKECA
jgi:hypothetical protein